VSPRIHIIDSRILTGVKETVTESVPLPTDLESEGAAFRILLRLDDVWKMVKRLHAEEHHTSQDIGHGFSCGFNSVYQRTAVVHTTVPETYSKLCRMFLRWDRSFVKEELRLIRLLWKRPYPARIISIIECVTSMRYPVSYMTLGLLVYYSLQNPMTFVRVLFMIGFVSLLNMVYYLRSERSLDCMYGVFYSYFAFFTLFWIFPYALATLRSRSWMTR
jgi:cellulose synthase/poly-beta-1,6-N-acetylglucosamine synthase-like glycosyltransferase